MRDTNRIPKIRFIFCVLLFGCSSFLSAWAQSGTAILLRNSVIWDKDTNAKAVGFRKVFYCPADFKKASICIFADNRYMLWINGRYAMRGPSRFDPRRPEYDSINIGSYLKTGRNSLAILVYGHISSGESMDHEPGLSVLLYAGKLRLTTDSSWKSSAHTRFQQPTVNWDGVRENVRADLEDGDWTLPGYNAQGWSRAIHKPGDSWGQLYPRTTPLSVNRIMKYKLPGSSLPVELRDSSRLFLKLERNVVGYCKLWFDADSGSRFSVFGHHYTARKGRQEYITGDVFGTGMTNIFMTSLPDEPDSVGVMIQMEKGRVSFTNIQIINFASPLELLGEFHTSDSLLNRFWKVITNMHAQVTQDTYTDGVSEGNEWVGDVHNISQFTRVAFALRKKNAGYDYAQNLYLRKALSDIAVSQQPDGRIKAHHPSDRFDLHWFIEDFAFIWIADLRYYYELSKDKAFLLRLWPVVKKQLQWFDDSLSARGLLRGREWCIFDNPYAYKRGEGATLNAFYYKALEDASILAAICGDQQLAEIYKTKAAAVKSAFNLYFWSDSLGSFRGMPDSLATTHAAVMALYTNICADSLRTRVENWLIKRNQDGMVYPFLHLFWFKCLYDMNRDSADQQVIDIIKSKYGNRWNAFNKGYLTAEALNNGRNFHNFGMAPGYFMSAYILGVRTVDKPTTHLLIEPRLGNLKQAGGKVLTPWGLVTVLWQTDSNTSGFSFSCTVPRSPETVIGIPIRANQSTLIWDGRVIWRKRNNSTAAVLVTDRFIYIENVQPGRHAGRLF